MPLQLLVLGLDGADWAILHPWLDAGLLPNLAGLKERGVWGPLRSTIRPESSIAWVTFATGVNAGRHGIYGFSGQQPHDYETHLNLSPAIRWPAFWQEAAAQGKRMAVMNVPMTYPPVPIPGGAVISGMLAPGLHSEFTSPAALRKQLLAAVPRYTLSVERSGLGLGKFIQETTRAIRARGEAAAWLLAREPRDAAIVVFTDTDRLQHYALHLLTPRHPSYDPAVAAALLPELMAAYQAIDEQVGRLLAIAGSEANVVVLSDHGFAPCSRSLYLNNWLEQQGLLRRTTVEQRSSLWQSLRSNASLRRVKRALPVVRHWRRPPPPRGHLSNIDWAQTAVVFSAAGGLRFNIRGREPEGVLSPDEADRTAADLSASLLSLVDPETGWRPVQAVYRREALYQGPFVDLAPDLVVELVRDDPEPGRNTAIAFDFAPPSSANGFVDSGDLTGNHALDGILIAAGPEMASQRIEKARLIDLAPTLLHALGLAVPRDLEGDVLPLWSQPRPVVWSDAGSGQLVGAAGTATLAPEDQATVEEHLAALGYL